MSIGLYIHVPFCLKKCNYCDFISYPYNEKDADAYLNALIKEMELVSASLPPEAKEVETIYLGGGTPTCLPAPALAAILGSCRRCFFVLPGAEITVEANPGTVDGVKLAALREAGVNRLSLGVQAVQERLLKFLGRMHTFEQAREAVRMAREAGFANLNLDLIFGIPGQTPADWEECLKRILDLRPSHVSTYGLQLEEGTPLWRDVQAGKVAPVDEEAELAMFELAIEILTAAGLIHYEISNFAVPAGRCRHNLRYWRNLPYLGLGPAAHSFSGSCRFSNETSLEKYVVRLKAGELPVAGREKLTRQTLLAETVFLGLRLREGLDLKAFADRFGQAVEEVYRVELDRLLKLNLIEIKNNFLRLTPRGLPVANQVFASFV
ncbi:MAG: radical SAM family heme chaperone HemW [Armatimonadetes bacterium]|nr:radical SAM family heme chaperone HemW [Armatimonadota bacterium]